MPVTTRRLRAILISTLTGALAAGGLVALGVQPASAAPAPVIQPGNDAITADRLPTVQMDGVAWSQAVVGNTVYVGGRFNNARPAGAAPGTNLTPRANLLAYDITTGNLVRSFAPEPQRRRCWGSRRRRTGAGSTSVGDFTTANGQARRRVAAFLQVAPQPGS